MLRLGAKLLRAAGVRALDLLLPPQCLTCEQPVAAQGLLCAGCFAETGFIGDPCCVQCGQPFSQAGAGMAGPFGLACPDCAAQPKPWRCGRAALRYDGQSRRLLLPFKYSDRTDLAGALAAMMARAGAALLREAEVLVPVPLHRSRLLSRRYNQAALLAHALARRTRLPCQPDALVRLRRTVPLGHLDGAQRAYLLAGAFAVRPGRGVGLHGKRVLLIDDVMTSGATCAACAGALLEAGAALVDVLVAARVVDRRLQ